MQWPVNRTSGGGGVSKKAYLCASLLFLQDVLDLSPLDRVGNRFDLGSHDVPREPLSDEARHAAENTSTGAAACRIRNRISGMVEYLPVSVDDVSFADKGIVARYGTALLADYRMCEYFYSHREIT